MWKLMTRAALILPDLLASLRCRRRLEPDYTCHSQMWTCFIMRAGVRNSGRTGPTFRFSLVISECKSLRKQPAMVWREVKVFPVSSFRHIRGEMRERIMGNAEAELWIHACASLPCAPSLPAPVKLVNFMWTKSRYDMVIKVYRVSCQLFSNITYTLSCHPKSIPYFSSNK